MEAGDEGESAAGRAETRWQESSTRGETRGNKTRNKKCMSFAVTVGQIIYQRVMCLPSPPWSHSSPMSIYFAGLVHALFYPHTAAINSLCKTHTCRRTHTHTHTDSPVGTAEAHMLKRKKVIRQNLGAEIHLVCVRATFETNLSSEHNRNK